MATPTHRIPEGGYILVEAGRILRAWELHHAKIITLLDLRVWLACHELVARRQGAQNRQRANYTHEELARLVSVTALGRIKGSLRRLERANLVTWSTNSVKVTHPGPPDSHTTFISIRRLVPMPRRMVRFLAAGASRSVIATAFGVMLRCLFIRRGECSGTGRCKASWVADTFGIDERSAKRARSELLRIGWVKPLDSSQWSMNRWGGQFQVNLNWRSPESKRPAPRMSPLSRPIEPRLSPPESNKHPLREYTHQNPARREPAGVWRNPAKRLLAPSLRDVHRLDLIDRERTLALHHQACERGLAERSEAGRLRFVGLAMHARRCGTRNPAGLFAWLLAGGRWGFITQIDEDQARELLRGEEEQSRPKPPRSKPQEPARRAFANAGLVGINLLSQLGRGDAQSGIAGHSKSRNWQLASPGSLSNPHTAQHAARKSTFTER